MSLTEAQSQDVSRLLRGDQRALARLLTLLERGGPDASALMRAIHPHTGRAYCVGVTGPPGAGKSTIVDGLTALWRADGLSVGILAVDPSSPFSGGALLGDRLRMQRHYLDSGVFIRSMASHGEGGGLPLAVGGAVRLLDASGVA
ncbi:MAG: methylmalonyl Co-A mutase-associated GTPase MeaB, partial [Chloroflexota bacterium]|nr:methylmalonyl Co-A mutase-associated GTPase MeaB [Chloroflexota bacterium]